MSLKKLRFNLPPSTVDSWCLPISVSQFVTPIFAGKAVSQRDYSRLEWVVIVFEKLRRFCQLRAARKAVTEAPSSYLSIRIQLRPPFRVQSRPLWRIGFGLIHVVHRRGPRPALRASRALAGDGPWEVPVRPRG
jgi:hypothetical protein